MKPQGGVRWLAGLSILTAAVAVVAPRLMHFRGDGFGPAASAVLLAAALAGFLWLLRF